MCYFVACATNCKKCETNGPGKCDTTECATDFTLNAATNLCDGECFDDCVVWTLKVMQYVGCLT